MFAKTALLALSAVALMAGSASAAPCKDAKGKFTKCPVAAAAPGVRCRDSKTKAFAKCSAPGAVPVLAKPAMTAASATVKK